MLFCQNSRTETHLLAISNSSYWSLGTFFESILFRIYYFNSQMLRAHAYPCIYLYEKHEQVKFLIFWFTTELNVIFFWRKLNDGSFDMLGRTRRITMHTYVWFVQLTYPPRIVILYSFHKRCTFDFFIYFNVMFHMS